MMLQPIKFLRREGYCGYEGLTRVMAGIRHARLDSSYLDRDQDPVLTFADF